MIRLADLLRELGKAREELTPWECQAIDERYWSQFLEGRPEANVKICHCCNRPQPRSAFRVRSRYRDGVTRTCTTCLERERRRQQRWRQGGAG